jgi:hypothetical protein
VPGYFKLSGSGSRAKMTDQMTQTCRVLRDRG